MKPCTTEHFYVDQRDRVTGSVRRWSAWCRPCKRAYQRAIRERDPEHDRERKRRAARERAERRVVDPVFAEQERARWRTHAARERVLYADRVYAAQKRYRDRVKADPERLQHRRETQRIARRLRNEREGLPLNRRTRVEGRGRHDEPPVRELPSGPLSDMLRAIAARESSPDGGSGEGRLGAVCARAGVTERTERRWRDGDMPTIRFDTADSALQGLGLLWFDVWDPDEHPDVAEAFGAS